MRPRILSPLLQLNALSAAALAAIIGVLSHAVTYESCRSIPGSSDARPDPGTPAAAYCNAVWHGYDWIAFGLAGAFAGVLAYRVLRPLKPSSRFTWSIGLALVLAVVNAAVADNLRSYFGA